MRRSSRSSIRSKLCAAFLTTFGQRRPRTSRWRSALCRPALRSFKLAVYLASRATEGDFGHDTLQEVTTTLAGAVQQAPPEDKPAASTRLQRTGGAGALRTHAGFARLAAVQSRNGQAGGRRCASARAPTSRSPICRANVDAERSERQSRAGELLGDVVPALPERNAGPGGALQSL